MELFAVKISDLPNHELLLFWSQFRVHRKGEDLCGGQLGVGKTSFMVAEMSKTRLQVQGERVIDLGLDSPFPQIAPEIVSLLDPDHIVIEDMAFAAAQRRKADDLLSNQTRFREKLLIAACAFYSLFTPLIHMAQLNHQHGGLNHIQT